MRAIHHSQVCYDERPCRGGAAHAAIYERPGRFRTHGPLHGRVRWIRVPHHDELRLGIRLWEHVPSIKRWLLTPSGYAIAPRSADIITEVIAKYGWDCAVLVVYDSSGFHNYYPAYLTGAQPRAGQVFGDSQAKAVRSSATGRYICPWTCYNILIRKQRDFNYKSSGE